MVKCLNNPAHELESSRKYFCSMECAIQYANNTAKDLGMRWCEECKEWHDEEFFHFKLITAEEYEQRIIESRKIDG